MTSQELILTVLTTISFILLIMFVIGVKKGNGNLYGAALIIMGLTGLFGWGGVAGGIHIREESVEAPEDLEITHFHNLLMLHFDSTKSRVYFFNNVDHKLDSITNDSIKFYIGYNSYGNETAIFPKIKGRTGRTQEIETIESQISDAEEKAEEEAKNE